MWGAAPGLPKIRLGLPGGPTSCHRAGGVEVFYRYSDRAVQLRLEVERQDFGDYGSRKVEVRWQVKPALS